MNCKKCGNKLEEGAKFCNKCGEKVVAESIPVSAEKTGKKSTLTSVVSVIVFILAIGVGRYLTQETFSPSTSSTSKAELISETVKEVKASMSLPNHVDEVTTLTDVTAEPGAIRYHYTLTGADTSSLSNTYLKNYLGSSLCQKNDTKNLLNRDINMEYSYIVSETGESYFVSFNKADCL